MILQIWASQQKLQNMRVICINDSNKPSKIPLEEWIEYGKIYTVIEVMKMGLQAGIFGYKLAEVALSEKSFPYEYYTSDRFAIVVETFEEKEAYTSELLEEELTI